MTKRPAVAATLRAFTAPLPVFAMALIVFVSAMLVQLPLALNPGYFSHDELQWAAIVAQDGVYDWSAIHSFQYRPLTFSVWIALSRAVFEQPQVFHTMLVAWGALNAALLAVLGRRLGLSTGAAALGALAFASGPYAMYVHGWVGTLGDLMWVACALLLGIVVSRSEHRVSIFLVALLLTTAALLAKEAAVSIPALLALAWWLGGRQRRWGIAAAGAALPVVVYLALRIGVLMFSARQGNAYDWSFGNIPLRWFEYQVYQPNIAVFEVATTLVRGFDKRVVISVALWLLLSVALVRIGWRWLTGFLLTGVAALAPVLVLEASANQYAYGFAAITALLVAAGWSRMNRIGHCIVAVLAILNLWHGINVMREMRRVGDIQAIFSPALADAVRQSRSPMLRLVPAMAGDVWIFQRLTHDIPIYRGIAIGHRAQLVETNAAADYRIDADGRLTRLRP